MCPVLICPCPSVPSLFCPIISLFLPLVCSAVSPCLCPSGPLPISLSLPSPCPSGFLSCCLPLPLFSVLLSPAPNKRLLRPCWRLCRLSWVLASGLGAAVAVGTGAAGSSSRASGHHVARQAGQLGGCELWAVRGPALCPLHPHPRPCTPLSIPSPFHVPGASHTGLSLFTCPQACRVFRSLASGPPRTLRSKQFSPEEWQLQLWTPL